MEKMGYANYRQIELAIIARDNFRGNSAWGMWVGGEYKVVSYNTLIAKIGRDGELYYNDTKYSRTTSRLQSIIRRSWGIKP
jgi:hypothetical protein